MNTINLDQPSNVPAIQALVQSTDEVTVKRAVENMLPYVESEKAFYEVYHAFIDALANLVHNFDYQPTSREKRACEVAYDEVVLHLGLITSDIY